MKKNDKGAFQNIQTSLLGATGSMSGVYRARVENNDDPYSIGRVQVRVPLLHGSTKTSMNYISSDMLPWAAPCFMSAGAGYGSFIVPEVGEYVIVAFEGGERDKPVYLGSCYGTGGSSKTYGSQSLKVSKDSVGLLGRVGGANSRKAKTNYGGKGTWESESGVNEVPYEAQKSQTHKVLYKSPKGQTVEVEEMDGEECISLTDILGQTIRLESNMKPESNVGNAARRIKGNTEESEADMTKSVGSRVLLCDATRQMIKMESNEDTSSMFFGHDETGLSIDTDRKTGASTMCLKISGGMQISVYKDEGGNTQFSLNAGGVTAFGNSNSMSFNTQNLQLSAGNVTVSGDTTIVEGECTASRADVVERAMACLGTKYDDSHSNHPTSGTPGQTGALDCSAFIYFVYQSLGYNFTPSNTRMYRSACSAGVLSQITRSQLQPGDVQCVYDLHVRMYIGGGKWIESVGGKGVLTDSWSDSDAGMLGHGEICYYAFNGFADEGSGGSGGSSGGGDFENMGVGGSGSSDLGDFSSDGVVSPFADDWRSHVSSEYGARISPITGEYEGHRGIDLRNGAGTPIRAVKAGVVTVAKHHYSYGNYIMIQHGDGCSTLYAHCSELCVSVGTRVGAGGIIAKVGSTGDSTGNHLHLEVKVGGNLVNPRTFLP